MAIKSLIEEVRKDKKIVIFCNFTDELLALQAHFGKKCVIHNGSMSAKEKQNSVDKFQTDDKIKVFIGTRLKKLSWRIKSQTAYLSACLVIMR